MNTESKSEWMEGKTADGTLARAESATFTFQGKEFTAGVTPRRVSRRRLKLTRIDRPKHGGTCNVLYETVRLSRRLGSGLA
jgi:hypothetical protein